MQYTLTITCRTEAELADITGRLTTVALSPATVTEQPETVAEQPETVAEAPAAAQPVPACAVSLDQIKAVGRKLVLAKRSAEVQHVLQAHGARMLSKLPTVEYPAVYAELNALLEGADHAPA